MEKFPKNFSGKSVHISGSDIDTDRIIPAAFLAVVSKDGLGDFAFDHERYEDVGSLGMDVSKRSKNPDFPLNIYEKKYPNKPTVLITGSNFGCGSSREHAPYSLADYGFKVIIAPSYAGIFYENSFNNCILCITLDLDTVEKLGKLSDESLAGPYKAFEISINLEKCELYYNDGEDHVVQFELDPELRDSLLEGRDFVANTIEKYGIEIHKDQINRKEKFPWE